MFKKKNLWLWGLVGVGAFLYFRGKTAEQEAAAAVALATQTAPTSSGDYTYLGDYVQIG